jgi:hypothetical protein
LGHQYDVPNCLADKISSIFGSNLVVPIISVDFKPLCDSGVDFGFDVFFFRTPALQGSSEELSGGYFENCCISRNGEVLSGVCSEKLRISTSRVILNSHLIVLWLKTKKVVLAYSAGRMEVLHWPHPAHGPLIEGL